MMFQVEVDIQQLMFFYNSQVAENFIFSCFCKFCNCGFGEIVKFNNFLYYENNILQIRKVYFFTFFVYAVSF